MIDENGEHYNPELVFSIARRLTNLLSTPNDWTHFIEQCIPGAVATVEQQGRKYHFSIIVVVEVGENEFPQDVFAEVKEALRLYESETFNNCKLSVGYVKRVK